VSSEDAQYEADMKAALHAQAENMKKIWGERHTIEVFEDENRIDIHLGHAEALCFSPEIEGDHAVWTVVATAWAPDHGVSDECVVVDWKPWRETEEMVTTFLQAVGWFHRPRLNR
jgi:hypothetical protein